MGVELTDKQLLELVYERGLEKEVLENIDDTICSMARDRNLEDNFDESSTDDEDAIDLEQQLKEWESEYHLLSKDFDRFELREHLLDIAGLQSHVSDKKLFDKLSDLLEFS